MRASDAARVLSSPLADSVPAWQTIREIGANALREVVNLKVDQVLIVDLGGNEEAAREAAITLGPGLPDQEAGIVVI